MGAKKPKMEVVEYYMSMHQAVCMGPVDEIRGIIIAEKEAWKGVTATNTSFTINKPELHGGVKKEGGAVGRVEVLMGGVDQVLPQYLASKLGLTTETAPAYRGVCSLFFSGTRHRGFYWTANQPYLRAIWVVAKRFARGLSSAYMSIGNDANPAHMIFETMTNETWGGGSPPSVFDLAALENLARLMHEEKFGLSMLWVNQGTIENFITEILDHIQATLFINPRTGLITVKPVRADYDLATLRTITPDNAKLSKFQRKGWGETTNEIVVTWTNPENEQEETVSIQDTANIAMQGGVVSESRNYYGVRDKDLAMSLAARDLRTASAPLAIMSAVVNREGWTDVPGDVIKVNWPERGLNDVACRIVDVDYGASTDTSIRLNLTEDIFAFTTAAYTNPPTSEWVDPSEDPRPLRDVLVFTLPYTMTMGMVDSDTLVDLVNPQVVTGILGAQTGQDTHEYDIVSATVPPSAELDDGYDESSLSIVAQGNIVTALAAESTSVDVRILNLTAGRSPQVGTFLIFGETDRDMEMCLVTASGASGFTLRRGVYDTVPRAWSANARVWIVTTDMIIYDPEQSTAGDIRQYKMLPRTSKGRLEWANAPVVQGAMSLRPWAPNRPANCAINTIGFGTVNLVTVPTINVTWANRNRLTEDTQVLAWNEATVPPESGQTTSLVIRNEQGVQINRIDGLTGTSYVLPREAFMGVSDAIVEFVASRAGIDSIQSHRINATVVATEPGHRYWRLLFPEGAVTTNYVQILRMRMWTDNMLISRDLSISTIEGIDGNAISSGHDGASYVPQNAFTDTNTGWAGPGGSGVGSWLGFHFNAPQRVSSVGASTVSQGVGRIFKSATLQHSDDGVVWTNAYATQPVRTGFIASSISLVRNPAKVPTNDGRAHRFWRVRSFNRLGSFIQWRRVMFNYLGVEQSIGGTPSASTTYSNTYLPANAFAAATTYWCSLQSLGGDDWLQYEFPAPVRVDEVTLLISGAASVDGGNYLFVEYSDDGVFWVTARFYNAAQATSHTIAVP